MHTKYFHTPTANSRYSWRVESIFEYCVNLFLNSKMLLGGKLNVLLMWGKWVHCRQERVVMYWNKAHTFLTLLFCLASRTTRDRGKHAGTKRASHPTHPSHTLYKHNHSQTHRKEMEDKWHVVFSYTLVLISELN